MYKIKKHAIKSIFILVILISCVITVYAIGFNEVVMEMALQTGEVKIDLNKGKPIFDKNCLNIEPNQTVVREFTVTNIGSADCYYKIYLEDVEGVLSDKIIFEIYDVDGKLVKEVTPNKFTSENAIDLHTILKPSEEVCFTIHAYLPKQSGNEYQTVDLTFDAVAEAIQSKNN